MAVEIPNLRRGPFPWPLALVLAITCAAVFFCPSESSAQDFTKTPDQSVVSFRYKIQAPAIPVVEVCLVKEGDDPTVPANRLACQTPAAPATEFADNEVVPASLTFPAAQGDTRYRAHSWTADGRVSAASNTMTVLGSPLPPILEP